MPSRPSVNFQRITMVVICKFCPKSISQLSFNLVREYDSMQYEEIFYGLEFSEK